MINVHNTKCLCGKGTVHYHCDDYGHIHSKLDCPECSRKYHVTSNGLMPRHIPIKYPKDHIHKQIERLKWRLRLDYPYYPEEVEMSFMTDEEKIIVYGSADKPVRYAMRYFNHEAMRITVFHSLMRELAYKYSKHHLLVMHDHIDDSIYDAEVERIGWQHHNFTEAELQAAMRRTIIDYEKHRAQHDKWNRDTEKAEQDLQEWYAKQEEARAALRKRWDECVIPWDQLEAL